MFHTVAQDDATAHMTHSMKKMIKMDFAIIFSSLENFYFERTEFRIILVSCPV